MAEISAQLANLTIAGNLGYIGSVEGKSTVFEMKVKPNSVVYRYDVEILKPAAERRPEKIYTKQNDLGMRTAQRLACNELIETLYGLTQSFGSDCKYIYDGKRTLYTNKPVKLQNQTTRIQPDQMQKKTAIFVKNDPVDVTITANDALPKLDYSDLKSALVTDVTLQADRSVRTFLELLTSQYLINTGNYQNITVGTLFENRTTPLVPGMEMRVGFKKGVRVTEHQGVPTPLMVVDMKRTAFFASKNVGVIYSDFLKIARNEDDAKRKFENHMKNVRVVVSYDTSRTFIFGRLTRFPISNQQFAVQGALLPAYMKQKHGVIINNTSWPGVHPQAPNGQRVVYPLEAIEVLHGQLVPIEKYTDQASRQLLMENSIKPDERYSYVLQQVRTISTGDSANFLQHFGVSIDVNSNMIKINQRKTPNILYKDNRIVRPQANGSWFKEATDAKFYVGSTRLKTWIVAFDQKINVNQVRTFTNRLLAKCRQLGMTIADPKDFVSTSLYDLETLFQRNQGATQMIFYIDEAFNKSHGKLKLYEAYFKILTQHVVAKNLTAQPLTLSNIAMKLNAKCFGINYIPQIPPELKSFDLMNCNDLLIIGLDVSHPSKLSPKEKFDLKKKHAEMENRHPSIVGICANKSAHPFAFAGDYFYQTSRREEIDGPSLSTAIAQIVEQAVKNGRRPKRLIVVRDGLSEGQLSMAAMEELPAIKAGWREGVPKTPETANVTPKIMFVVCTKRHQKRFYRFDGKQVSNTVPGDVIDSKVTRTDVPEFFLQSHCPVKGVSKIPQYNVVANELNMTIGEMQNLMGHLSNMHQVCACPTSLPLPVYLAHETAKRGQDIYNELFNLRSFAPRGPQPAKVFASDIRMVDGVFNFSDLTNLLGYSASKLVGTRFNA